MDLYMNMAVFAFFIGAVAGVLTVPTVYLIKKRRKFGKKHGFRKYTDPHLEADATLFGEDREEHSIESFRS